MSRIRFMLSLSFLFVGLALVAASCSATVATTADDLEEGAQQSVEAPAEDVGDEPAGEPEEPTPLPTEEPAPAPTEEPASEPLDDAAAIRQAAIDRINTSDFLTIDTAITTTILSQDLELNLRSEIDLIQEVQRKEVTLSGEGWDDLAGGDADTSADGFTLEYAFSGQGSIYFKTEPLAADTDPAKPWIELRPNDVAASAGELASYATDPLLDRDVLIEYLKLDGIVGNTELIELDGETVRAVTVLVPNEDAFWVLPRQTVDGVIDSIDPQELRGTTAIRYQFADAGLSQIDVNFGSLLPELVEIGAPAQLGLMEINNQIQVSYEPVEVSLPDDDQITFSPAPTEPLPLITTVGTCFARDDFELVERPLTVPCTEPHYAEIYHVQHLDIPFETPFPGDQETIAIAGEACAPTFEAIHGSHQDITVLRIQLWRPTAESWAAFDREVACFARFDEPSSTPFAELDPLRNEAEVSSFALETGDCFNTDDLFVTVYELVDCSVPHLYETYYTLQLDPGTYPGDDEVAELADATCIEQFETIIGESYDTSAWFIERLFPGGFGWDVYDDRIISCMITTFDPVEGSALDG